MLPAWFIIVAVAIRIIGGTFYLRAVLRRKAQPNPITWFFWALTAGIVFIAQIFEHVGWSAATTFALALTPTAIFIASLRHNLTRAHFTKATIGCGVMAGLGIVLWQITNDPVQAIVFCIIADIFGSVPTLEKAYKQPHSEVALPYWLSVISMGVTLLIIDTWTFANYAFPIYIAAINLSVIGMRMLGMRKIKPMLAPLTLPSTNDTPQKKL